MKHSRSHAAFATLSFILVGIFVSDKTLAAVTGSMAEGWCIFSPPTAEANYRYGPSMIINSDGSLDAWFASPGPVVGSIPWDTIKYKRSYDGGLTWSAETTVLSPTSGSADYLSVCDPSVIKFGGYYYIGYTSTADANGEFNHVFVARGESPSGPWSKWNGSGWGGNPQPIIAYSGPPTDVFGIGEPSFVVKDGILYIYYSYWSRDTVSGKAISQTRVATASTSNPDWPGSMTFHGVAIDRGDASTDSSDHKYVPSLNKFIAICTSKRIGPSAYIRLYESADGFTYKLATLPKDFTHMALHNAGITGNELGHFDTSQANRIAYAAGGLWAYWNTYMHPFTLTDNSLPAQSRIEMAHAGDGQVQIQFNTTGIAGETYKIKYGTLSGTYTATISGLTSSPYTVTGLTNGTTYYFAVVASNASGDSPSSQQAKATPLAYTAAPRISAVASSTVALPGWDVSNLMDGNITTCWSSQLHTSATPVANQEWVTIDTGANRSIKSVSLTMRQFEPYGAPAEYEIHVSRDNATWTKADLMDDNVFAEPISGRYVKVLATSLGHDSGTPMGTPESPLNYCFQLAEVDIEEIPYQASGSPALPGWSHDNVLDGNQNSVYSSYGYTTPTGAEWIGINAGAVTKTSGMRILPRDGGLGFPVDFKFQQSSDGVNNWTDIPGASYSNYPNPGSALQTFHFINEVQAQYVRLYATKLGSDGTGNYYLQVADMYLSTTPYRIAAATSTLAGWEVSRLVDNQNATYWSSVQRGSANSIESVAVDTDSQQNFSGITIIPRPGNCFPADFQILYSNDGYAWYLVPGQSYRSYVAGVTPQKFKFSSPISATFLAVYATKLSPDTNGNYFMQFGEIYLDR